MKKKTALWATLVTLASVAACNGGGSSGDGDGDGDGDTGGTASGGTGPSSGGLGGGESGGASSGGASSGGAFNSTGGMGGIVDPCGEDWPVLQESEDLYADFEGLSTETEEGTEFDVAGADAKVYWYNDGGEATNDFVEGIAEGEQALHIAYSPTVWGGGTGFWNTCIDASVFTGISFWAKGELPTPGEIQVELQVPDTTPVGHDSGTGNCLGVSGNSCFANKVMVPGLTSEWKQFFLTWEDFSGGSNVGAPVALDPTRINGLNFHAPFASGATGTIDLYIDDVRFTTEDGGMGGAGGAVN